MSPSRHGKLAFARYQGSKYVPVPVTTSYGQQIFLLSEVRDASRANRAKEEGRSRPIPEDLLGPATCQSCRTIFRREL
jgi:hypothetical protein